jgi:predicted TPR repeat methyltransferase
MTDSDEPSGQEEEISVLDQAMRLHRSGHLEPAISVYRQVLEYNPEHPDALHYLGLACHATGDFEQAIAHISKALTIAPDYVEALNNLGVIYQSMGRLEEAEGCYARVIEICPEHSDSHNNLGVVLKSQGRMRDAATAFEQALALDPNHARAHHNLGNLYRRAKHHEEAIFHFRAAIDAGLQTMEARQALVNALYKSGQRAEAVAALNEWLEVEPAHPIALHMKAALQASQAPSRASDDYVKTVFDEMAGSFDQHLGGLGYRAPALVIDALHAAVKADTGGMRILDAGCGTGLCGPLVKPLAAHLTGVDLSPKMLHRAQLTGAYDALYEAELTAFLQHHTDAWDVIICADTLCYFGDLAEVSQAAAAALKPGGHFVFTVEHLEGDHEAGFSLNPNGRYGHTKEYVRDILEQAGFHAHSPGIEILRRESGNDVEGLVVCATRPMATC